MTESYDLDELKENMSVEEEDLHIEGDEDDPIIDDEDNNDDVICDVFFTGYKNMV